MRRDNFRLSCSIAKDAKTRRAIQFAIAITSAGFAFFAVTNTL
jgi:hypothetical protein